MKYYFQHDKQGMVASYSETELLAPNFTQILLNVSDEQMKLLMQNYTASIRDGALILEKTSRVIEEENKLDIKQKVIKAKNIEELKDIVLSIFS